MSGALVLAATPIGNLGDASMRLQEHLRTADVIAVEDSRRLISLVRGLGLEYSGRVVTTHDHNEQHRAEDLVRAVQSGQTVLMISDAGMPTVSDPGYRVVQRALEEGIEPTCLPGPSAVLTALALSGLPTDRFTFEGFLPRKASERRARVKELAAERRTMVFYEAPHRLVSTLGDLLEAFGDQRRGAVARELTKMHEQVRRGPLGELLRWAEEQTVRGEIAIVLEGAPAPEAADPAALTELVEQKVAAGLRLKEATAEIASLHGVARRELYQAVLIARGEHARHGS